MKPFVLIIFSLLLPALLWARLPLKFDVQKECEKRKDAAFLPYDCKLQKPSTIDGVTLEKGCEITFSKKALLSRIRCDIVKKFQRRLWDTSQELDFSVPGTVASGVLAEDSVMEGYPLPKGSRVWFGENGRMVKVALGNHMVRENVFYKPETILYLDNGTITRTVRGWLKPKPPEPENGEEKGKKEGGHGKKEEKKEEGKKEEPKEEKKH